MTYLFESAHIHVCKSTKYDHRRKVDHRLIPSVSTQPRNGFTLSPAGLQF